MIEKDVILHSHHVSFLPNIEWNVRFISREIIFHDTWLLFEYLFFFRLITSRLYFLPTFYGWDVHSLSFENKINFKGWLPTKCTFNFSCFIFHPWSILSPRTFTRLFTSCFMASGWHCATTNFHDTEKLWRTAQLWLMKLYVDIDDVVNG